MSNILRFKIYDGRLIQNTDIASTIFQGFANGLDAITLPAWFNKNNKNTKNVTCSFIKIFTNSTSFHYLLWVYSPDALIEGYYDTALNEVRINKMKAVKHCAWYCNDRSTLLKSWEAPVAVGVSPKMRIWNTSCPGNFIGAVDFQFADTKTLTDQVSGNNLITFTRASSATERGSDGQIAIAATNEPRFDHDPATGESLGLLVEDASTNLLLNSETLSTQNVTVAASPQVLSFYGTGTVTLSGVSTAGPLVGTGVNDRVELAFTPTAGSLTVTVAGSVTKAQLEAGSKASSYIPTTSATVTRAADVASVTGTNFSDWYNHSEGTFVVEFSTPDVKYDTDGRAFTVSRGTTNSGPLYIGKASGTPQFINARYAGGVELFGTETDWPNFQKSALAYNSTDYTLAVNGFTINTTASTSVDAGIDSMFIGARRPSSNFLNGHIKRLSYLNTAEDAAALETLTNR